MPNVTANARNKGAIRGAEAVIAAVGKAGHRKVDQVAAGKEVLLKADRLKVNRVAVGRMVEAEVKNAAGKIAGEKNGAVKSEAANATRVPAHRMNEV